MKKKNQSIHTVHCDCPSVSLVIRSIRPVCCNANTNLSFLYCCFFVDDNVKLTAPQYRERLYQEITNRRRESRKKEGGGSNGGTGILAPGGTVGP